MIGLAISMGATSLLLPRQGDSARAAEPLAANPSAPSPQAATFGRLEHVVQHGQTLDRVARLYSTTATAIARANGLVETAALQPGQVLEVPARVALAPEGVSLTHLSRSEASPTNRELTESAEEPGGDRLAAERDGTAPVLETSPAGVPVPVARDRAAAGANGVASSPDLTRLHAERERLAALLAELNGLRAAAEAESLAEGEATAPTTTFGATFDEPSLDRPQFDADFETALADPEVEGAEFDTFSNRDGAAAESPAFAARALETPEVEIDRSEAPADGSASAEIGLPEAGTLEAPVPVLPLAEDAGESAAPAAVGTRALDAAIAAAPTLPDRAPSDSGAELPDAPAIAPPDDREGAASAPDADGDGSADRVYRVRPGDTLAEISSLYGLSVERLVEANDLDDPHFLSINQPIVIPEVPGTGGAAIAGDRVPVLPAPGWAEGAIAAETELPTRPAAVVEPALAEATAPVPAAARARTQTYSPYVEGLRAEIESLRERYQVSAASPATEVASDGEAVEAEAPVADAEAPQAFAAASTRPDASNAAQDVALNPEFSPERFAALNADEFRRFSREAGSADLPTAEEAAEAEPGDRDAAAVVAAAPGRLDADDARVQPLLGETVSPELPPLSAANTYLPDSNRFDGYIWPTRGVLTSGYGWRWGRMHRGIDIAAPTGTPIAAAAAGVVVFSGWNSGGYGNLVDIRHADGSLTRYAHNSRNLVRKGQRVRQGETIAEMGSTGFSTGPHLHFEVHPSGRGAVNPMAFLPRGGLQAAR